MKIKNLPSSLHFVGVGGIGMSGLAQMAHSLGCRVSGSDRALNSPENARIIDSLRRQGIVLYPQDGSCYQTETPDALVYSTAIEENNPDFLHAPAGTVRLHRSEALELCIGALGGQSVFAVTGTCGKTTVSAWLAEALWNLNGDPSFLSGGLLNRFSSSELAGNYRKGSGSVCVIEADESDKSLLNYTADMALVLNIGTDHYSKEELARVFREFLLKIRSFGILEDRAFLEIGPDSLASADLVLFSTDFDAPSELSGRPVYKLDSYRIDGNGAYTAFDGQEEIHLPAPGLHNAANALAVYASLRKLGYAGMDAARSVGCFSGVWRRFDLAGNNSNGAAVYDDYAHNVEKIVSCLNAARTICDGRLFAFFQPHGFGPLKFMRQELFDGLETTLTGQDVFSLMPVYYAGGTTSFTPTSEEVIAEYVSKTSYPEHYGFFADRADAEEFIRKESRRGDVILVMGARDNSLSDWAKKLVATSI